MLFSYILSKEIVLLCPAGVLGCLHVLEAPSAILCSACLCHGPSRGSPAHRVGFGPLAVEEEYLDNFPHYNFERIQPLSPTS